MGSHISSTASYMYPSSSSSSTSGNSLLNLRDFALSGGGGGGGGNSASINKNKSATTTIQPPLIDTQLIVVTAVAWSNGTAAATTSTTNTGTHLSTNDSTTGTDSNNNDTDSVQSKTTTTSLLQKLDDSDDVQEQEHQKQQQLLRTSMIAVAGSNGVIAIWNVATLLGLDDTEATKDNYHKITHDTSHHNYKGNNNTVPYPPLRTTVQITSTPSLMAQQPSAILNHHVRQVNALAFHPMKHGLLLSASQDCTVIVWEQRKSTASTPTTTNPHANNNYKTNNHQQQQFGLKGLFGAFGGTQQPVSSSLSQQSFQHSYTWHCRTTFTPKSEAIRDVQWSPIFTDGTVIDS